MKQPTHIKPISVAPEDQDPRLSYTEDGRRPLTSTTTANHPNAIFTMLIEKRTAERSARDSYDQYGNNVSMHWEKGPWN